MSWTPENDCKHKNKIATDSYNMDMEIFWECPDCGCGWREEPKTKREFELAENISDENDELDAKALGLDLKKIKKELLIKELKKI